MLNQIEKYPKVPMTRVEMCLFPSSNAVRAKPKSETFGVKSCSNKMLLDLKSLCMTLGLESSCKYARPLAAPSAIFTREPQSSGAVNLSTPETKQNMFRYIHLERVSNGTVST